MINYYVEYSIIVSKFHFMKLEINKKILQKISLSIIFHEFLLIDWLSSHLWLTHCLEVVRIPILELYIFSSLTFAPSFCSKLSFLMLNSMSAYNKIVATLFT